MAFYKAVKMKTDGKWYPQAVQVDQPFTTGPDTGEDTGSDGSFG